MTPKAQSKKETNFTSKFKTLAIKMTIKEIKDTHQWKISVNYIFNESSVPWHVKNSDQQ